MLFSHDLDIDEENRNSNGGKLYHHTFVDEHQDTNIITPSNIELTTELSPFDV